MEEEINRQTISLCIKGGKISAQILKKALDYTIKQLEKDKTIIRSTKTAAKNQPVRGKQTLQDLTGQNAKLTNIQITDNNIGTFDRVARKYDVDYALKKDNTVSPPRYYVFFKAKDVDVMTAAFKEYTANVTRKQTRPSVCKALHKALETVRQTQPIQKIRNKIQEHSR